MNYSMLVNIQISILLSRLLDSKFVLKKVTVQREREREKISDCVLEVKVPFYAQSIAKNHKCSENSISRLCIHTYTHY